MKLHVLPTRSASASENMAIDFLLLQRYPAPAAPRFRHYGWHRPAFTFGYAQKIAFVREQLVAITGEPEAHFDLCRRPTGGGIVDHRDDWTYALVIPRGHPMEELRATHSYQAVHRALAGALQAQGVEAGLQAAGAEDIDAPALATAGLPSEALAKEGVCFQRAEIHDVVHGQTGEKIAGAAQKRNKHGLLFQGSVWRPAAGGVVEWERFEADFVAAIATELMAEPAPTPWPEFNEDEVSGLAEQYSSADWIEYR